MFPTSDYRDSYAKRYGRATFEKCSGAFCKARWMRRSCSTAIPGIQQIRLSKQQRMGYGISRTALTMSGRVYNAQGTCRWNGQSKLTGRTWWWGGTTPMNARVGMQLGGTLKHTHNRILLGGQLYSYISVSHIT